MRIVHVAPFYAPVVGGVEEVVRKVAEYTASKGYETYVVTYNRLRRGGHNTLPREEEINGVHVIRLKPDFTWSHGSARWLDLETLLKALSRAKERKPAKMLIVGKHLQTTYPRKVEEAIRRYGLQKHVTWLDFVPHEEVPRYMAAIDLGAIPFNTANPTAWYAAPNKMWEYASQGDTVVSTPTPEAVAHSKAIDVRLVESSEDYEKAILEAEPLTQKERAERMARATPLLLKRTWMESAKRFGRVIVQTIRERP